MQHCHDRPFGNYHFVCAGDFAQHGPVKGLSLMSPVPNAPPNASDAEKRRTGKAAAGRDLWLSIDRVVILREQHRFNCSTPDGKTLHDVVHMLTHGTHPDHNHPLKEADIEDLADKLNSCAVTDDDMEAFLAKKPRACVLRHNVRPALNRFLVSNNSGHSGFRPIVWRQRDESTAKHGKSGKPLSSEVMSILAKRTPKADDIPPVQYFYPGIPYRFISNEYPLIGWVNNGTCIGERIILHPDEPIDDLHGDFWTLKYPPIAVIVRIDGRDVGDMFGAPVPTGCVPVFPIRSKKPMSHDWGRTLRLYAAANDNTRATSVSFNRIGMPIDPAVTFTDFYAQGQSFKGAPHFLHLNISSGAPWNKANLLVPISRAATWSDVKLAHPLWNAGDTSQRNRVIGHITNALRPKPSYVTELVRLEALHRATHNIFYDALMNNTDSLDVDFDEEVVTKKTSQQPLPRPIRPINPSVDRPITNHTSIPSRSKPTNQTSTANRPITNTTFIPPNSKATVNVAAFTRTPIQTAPVARERSHGCGIKITTAPSARPNTTLRHGKPTTSVSDDDMLIGIDAPTTTITPRLSVDAILDCIGRMSCGPDATPSDGNCALLAFQQCKRLADAADRQDRTEPIPATTDEHAHVQHLRTLIQQTIRSSTTLQRIMDDDFCTQLASVHGGLGVNVIDLPGNGHNWTTMADHYAKARFWLDSAALRALAIGTSTDIVVVYSNSTISWFPADDGHVFTTDSIRGRRQRFRTDTFPSMTYPAYASTPCIPPVAFEPSTVVICHSGVHFWCTKVADEGYRNVGSHFARCRSFCEMTGKILNLRWGLNASRLHAVAPGKRRAAL